MDYKALNENQRKRMLQISKNDFSMEWENPDFLDCHPHLCGCYQGSDGIIPVFVLILFFIVPVLRNLDDLCA